MILATVWFILVFVLLTGYMVLDGFDLGVGALHLLARDDRERRMSLNSIGPVWDGNEVWLLTAGGALFAAFPAVYATVFSAFYVALMLVLAALMFRAVSLEFRGKIESARWRRFWDISFSVSSILLPVLYGVAFGNIIRGIPLTAAGDYTGTFLGLLNPYAVLVGLLTLALCVLHGATYLIGKSDGPMQARARRVAWWAWVTTVVLIGAVTVSTALAAPSQLQGIGSKPLVWLLAVVVLAATAMVPLTLAGDRLRSAFVASGLMIASMTGLAAAGLFPRMVPSSIDAAFSLTTANSSSTPRTLTIMLAIALIGMPLVIGYTAIIYRVFRGKVVLTQDSY
jgi:cytochrome d ubiquinol oxidase subunit II